MAPSESRFFCHKIVDFKKVDIPLLSFFNEMLESFQRAKQAVGTLERYYTLGDEPIRLCFAGEALLPFVTRALEHLTSKPASAPSLKVYLWDSTSTKIEISLPTWLWNNDQTRGEVRGFDGRILITFQPDLGILHLMDRQTSVALFYIPDASRIPSYEMSAPLIRILPSWLLERGSLIVHTGAVGTSEGGALLVGKGGSGKSTTALACLNSHLLYAGDDYVLLSEKPCPTVYSLYNSAKFDAQSIQEFEYLLPAACNRERLDQEKAVIFLNETHPHKIIKSLPLRAVCLPKITGCLQPTLTPISTMEAFKALAPSTIFQLRGTESQTFHRIARLIQQFPCYTLELGSDISKIPNLILELLSP